MIHDRFAIDSFQENLKKSQSRTTWTLVNLIIFRLSLISLVKIDSGTWLVKASNNFKLDSFKLCRPKAFTLRFCSFAKSISLALNSSDLKDFRLIAPDFLSALAFVFSSSPLNVLLTNKEFLSAI